MVKKLILCEGGDDIAFLNRYLSEFLCIDKKTYEIRKMENKSNFFKKDSYITIIQQVKANLYDKVLFVLDSDFEALSIFFLFPVVRTYGKAQPHNRCIFRVD
jgi:hypothetical protein